MDDIKFMRRCIDLASKGIGNTYPNPLVGSVIVHNNKIIGEGYHAKYGESHAEVDAIKSVTNKELLKDSTLYVSLEPCNHHGKTPPCSETIINNDIKKIVIGSRDPNKFVEGNGIKKLQSNGCEVISGVMEKECDRLNKRFFTYHKRKRPYIILKWAESNDGFIAPNREKKLKREVFQISGEQSKKISHYWRSEEHAILVGVQTIIDDDPLLTTRLVSGANPVRIILDPNQRILKNSKIFSKDSRTIILSDQNKKPFLPENQIINFKSINSILDSIYNLKIQSIIVEGGTRTLNHFLKNNKWDSIRVFKSTKNLGEGIKGPMLDLNKFTKRKIGEDFLYEIER